MRQETRTSALSSLYEKTFNFAEDVNFIYKTCFKNQIRDFVKGKIPFVYEFTKFGVLDSSDLVSEVCVEANNIKPVVIYCGIFEKSIYIPKTKDNKIGSIFISLNNYYSDIYSRTRFNKDIVISTIREQKGLHSEQERFFKDYLEEDTIKLTIQHELSHWLSDTLRNKFLTKIIDDANLLAPPLNLEYLKLGLDNVNLTHYELDAQVHEVAYTKTFFSKEDWDKLSWEDLLFIKGSSLKVIQSNMKKEKLYGVWVRLLATRLFKENLLGRRMIKELTGKLEDFDSLGF